MFGSRIVRAFEEVKTRSTRPDCSPREDRAARRRWTIAHCSASSRLSQMPVDTVLDWSEWGSFASAAEMCNNKAPAANPTRRDVPVLPCDWHESI